MKKAIVGVISAFISRCYANLSLTADSLSEPERLMSPILTRASRRQTPKLGNTRSSEFREPGSSFKDVLGIPMMKAVAPEEVNELERLDMEQVL